VYLTGEVGLAAIEVSSLRKAYGPLVAVRDVSFAVDEGEIVAMLGPNGAGKTTTVEIIEGFRPRDAGRVTVLGRDPAHAERAFYERLGVVLQECEPEPYLTVVELLELHRGYYRQPLAVDDLLDLVGLSTNAGVRVRRLSGGQRRRLDLALALVGQPAVVFLDEPTTGFDPEARLIAWDTIRRLRDTGTTVLLTTHYLEEAAALADRVVVISGGTVVADGSPASLGSLHDTRISFRLPDGVATDDLPIAGVTNGQCWSARTSEPTKALGRLTAWANENGHELEQLTVRPPSLEDAYLELTA